MFKTITNYCKESYDELVHKVSWPTRSELSGSAVAVLTASLLIALVVFLMDSAFRQDCSEAAQVERAAGGSGKCGDAEIYRK